MTDAALRALEREARARPSDLAAGWAYAVGLERAGERRALWLELCRLARAGDARAVAAIDGWLPGLGGTTPRAPSLRAPKVARVALIEDEAFDLGPVTAVRSSPGGRLFVLADTEALVVDLSTERVVWRRRDAVALLPCGDDALIVAQDRTALVRCAEDDAPVSGAGLVGPGEVTSAAAWGDRAIVQLSGGRTNTCQVFDAGAELGAVIWRGDLPGAPQALTPTTVLLQEDDEEGVWSVVGRDLVTGAARWSHRIEPGPERAFGWLADGRGALLHQWLDLRHDEGRTTELDPASGEVRWSIRHGCGELGPLLASRRAVYSDRIDQALVGVGRRGEGVWRCSRTFTDEDRLVDGDDVLYVLGIRDGRLELWLVDANTGALRGSARAPLPVGDAFVAHACGGRSGVDVVLTTNGPLAMFVRFAD